MAMAAIWLQGLDSFSDDGSKLMTIFIGLVALAMVAQAIALIAFAAKSAKAIKGLVDTVEDLKQRVMPLIDSATEVSRATETLLRENAPKVKTVVDNLVETSATVRSTADRLGKTIADANQRTQRQVAKVDGMVSVALATTVEIVETIADGIRGPVQVIAAVAGQAKKIAEGLLAKFRSAGSRFGD